MSDGEGMMKRGEYEIIFWREDHGKGEHIHIENGSGKLRQPKLYEKILKMCEEMNEKYRLTSRFNWDGSVNVEDDKKRTYLHISCPLIFGFPRKYRIHVDLFERGEFYFKELMQKLRAKEIVT
jgi:hypothetical protein